MSPAPASLCRSSCAPCCVPASSTIYRDCAPPPPFCPRPTPKILSDHGGFAHRRSLCNPSALAFTSLSSPLNPHIFWFLVPCWVYFRKRARGQGAFTTCQLLALDPPHPPPSAVLVFVAHAMVYVKRTIVMILRITPGISMIESNYHGGQ